jgi:hypothetical protein
MRDLPVGVGKYNCSKAVAVCSAYGVEEQHFFDISMLHHFLVPRVDPHETDNLSPYSPSIIEGGSGGAPPSSIGLGTDGEEIIDLSTPSP